MKNSSQIDLRFGIIGSLYYQVSEAAVPKQLDLLDQWFPGLVVKVEPSDGNTRIPAEYIDHEYMIHAVRYRGRLYSGSSTRISQILGRLTGTAAGNQEKERKTAELIQQHIAECFISDMTLTPRLKDHMRNQLSLLTDAQLKQLDAVLLGGVYSLAENRKEKDDYARKNELFSMYDETFDGIIYNAAYQLHLETLNGLGNAYLWLLTGSLLRNEAGRVLRLYDTSFLAVNRQISETGELEDKLNYLFHPEQYYDTFHGDEADLKQRFPDVWWTCDQCGASLNDQEGFDDHLPEWKCRKCGFVNRLDISEIYQNEEDYRNHIHQTDPVKFEAALKHRAEELKAHDKK